MVRGRLRLALLATVAGCDGGGGAEPQDAEDEVVDATDGDVTTDAGDGDAADGETAEPSLPGTYALTTWLEAYPALPRDGTSAGDCFDTLADFVGDPSGGLAEAILRAATAGSGEPLPDAVQAILVARVDAVLCGCHLSWCADPEAARSPFRGVAVGLPVVGRLVIDTPPAPDGSLAASQIHTYDSVVLPRALPCNGPASPACIPESVRVDELLSWPTYDGAASWGGRDDLAGLTISEHPVPLPVGRILRAAIERRLLPALLGDPALDGWDAVFDAWLPRCVIRTWNATAPADERLPEDGGCLEAGSAWARLVTPDEPTLAGIVQTAFAAVCDERHDTIASCLPSIDHVARAGASFASASPCPATDADGDGLVDGFGLDTDCPWNVGWRDSGGEREVAGRFEARRLVR